MRDMYKRRSSTKQQLERVKDMTCPQCGSQLERKYANKAFGKITLACPKCKSRYIQEMGICPMCDDYNNYPSDGLCRKCYADKKEAG